MGFILRRLYENSDSDQVAWLVGGDFNEILRLQEKSGGRGRNLRQIEMFQQATADCNLQDVFEDQAGFTWSNKRANDSEIRARLDRFLMNSKWLELFPHAEFKTLDYYGSDHQALLLSLKQDVNAHFFEGKKRFHFEQKWFLKDNFVNDFLMS